MRSLVTLFYTCFAADDPFTSRALNSRGQVLLHTGRNANYRHRDRCKCFFHRVNQNTCGEWFSTGIAAWGIRTTYEVTSNMATAWQSNM